MMLSESQSTAAPGPQRNAGLDAPLPHVPNARLIQYINLKLAALGCATLEVENDPEFNEMTASMLAYQRETHRLLANYLCPADNRIQTFLYDYLQGAPVAKLPPRTFVLDRYGLARALSLPPTRDDFTSDIVHSYRVQQGVLHNPKSDRRTTRLRSCCSSRWRHLANCCDCLSRPRRHSPRSVSFHCCCDPPFVRACLATRKN